MNATTTGETLTMTIPLDDNSLLQWELPKAVSQDGWSRIESVIALYKDLVPTQSAEQPDDAASRHEEDS